MGYAFQITLFVEFSTALGHLLPVGPHRSQAYWPPHGSLCQMSRDLPLGGHRALVQSQEPLTKADTQRTFLRPQWSLRSR